jgi:quercetin dioxygenase-like cupin family protein
MEVMTDGHQMRILITGVDADGRSCVISEEVAFQTTPDGVFNFAVAYRTASAPPPSRPQGRADLMDLQVPPGIAQWMVVDYEPGGVQENHHTDTVDFDLVLQGSIDLTLDDGVHRLEPGDGVVVNGVDHAWKAGPDGCRLSVMAVGTPPRM